MLRFTLVVILVGVVVGVQLTAKLQSQWKLFKSTHNKEYSGPDEEARKETFVKKVREIDEHNLRADRGEETYHRGINQFTDMTQEEFENTMLVPQSPSKIENHGVGYFRYTYDPYLKVPEHYDSRDHGFVTHVKDQGRCGSCWAFAAVAAIEVAWAKAHGEKEFFSEQQLIDCPDERKYLAYKCKRGDPLHAIRYITDNGGINTDSCYPTKYTGRNGTVCYYNPNCKRALVNYGLMKKQEEVIKQVIYTHGHAITEIKVEGPFENYLGGLYTTPCATSGINHFVVFVGYGRDKKGNDYWLAKNSWGPKWGEGGYIRIIRNKNLCNVESFPSYAVLLRQ